MIAVICKICPSLFRLGNFFLGEDGRPFLAIDETVHHRKLQRYSNVSLQRSHARRLAVRVVVSPSNSPATT